MWPKNKASGEAKFKEINEAYEVLGDTRPKRQQYDQLGANYQHGAEFPRSAGGTRRGYSNPQGEGSPFEFSGTGFSDFFETFFAGRRGGNNGHPFRDNSAYGHESPRAARGHDAEADILVTLEEALRGSKREVTVRRADGQSTRTDTYSVKIPAGVEEGKLIRLKGQGSPGHGGGPAGDLFLRMRMAKHPEFSVEGADLTYDLDLAPWEAALGAKVTIPTLDGPATVQIKPGLPSGSKVRLRGLGMSKAKGARGDLFVVTSIQFPTSVTKEEQALWEQLAKTSSFNPRIH